LQRPLPYHLYRWAWSSLDWLYPPYCGGCGRKGVRWCPSCQAQVALLRPPLCPACGQSQLHPSLCRSCQSSPPLCAQVRSWAHFDGPVRLALHRLKYRKDLALGDALAAHLLQLVSTLPWRFDLVAPVPLGLARLRQRGYNQAALLARPLALGLRIAYKPQALSKVRETRTQVDLNVIDRKSNVAGAFAAHRKTVLGRSVLLVDDVTTSGATLDACASALLSAGASQVYGLTLARAGLHSHRSSPGQELQA
jgi:competence protein ComFC